jgi:putative cofactor-binding repeat protein/parallel beta-helix repeat protein
MKHLLLLLLVPSLLFAQKWDSTKTTDTPRSGMYKFNAGIKDYIAGKKLDTTGMSAMTNPIFVLRGDSMWIAREGTLDSTTSGRLPYKTSSNSLSSLGGVYTPVGLNGNGTADNRAAIQNAIDAASANGGGTVLLPSGTFKLTTFSDTGYVTPDSVAAPGGYPTSFSTSDIHLKDTVGNVVLRGTGYGSTIITTASPSIILLIAKSHKDSTLKGIRVEGITFQYTGGYYGGRHGGAYGVWINGQSASISGCKFKDFLNSVIIGRSSNDCIVENNVFESTHGKASCGYPLYPDRNTGDVYWAHPAVFLRNYGTRTRAINNFADCLTSANFTGITAPDSFKTPMDGFNHGSGNGGVFVGNTVLHFYIEGMYQEEGPSTQTATTVYTANILDGTIPTFTNGIPATHAKYAVYGRWGIRADCWNASITGNTIRNVSQVGIMIAYATDHAQNFTISGNVLQNVARGIRIDSASHGTIAGNTIIAVEPTQTQKDSGLVWKHGIEMYRSNGVNVNGNTIYGSHTGWYWNIDTATVQSDSAATDTLWMTSTTGLAVGDWIYAHYSVSGLSQGEYYYISALGATWIKSNVDVSKTILVGDSLFLARDDVEQYANDGVTLVESDTCQIVGNTFINVNNPIYGIGNNHSAGANTYLNCFSDPTGGVALRFSLIGGATPISTSGSITTTAGLAGEYLILEAWQYISTVTGAFYLRPGSGQVAMYDGSTKHYQFDLYDSTAQNISLKSDTASFIKGELGVNSLKSLLTATKIDSFRVVVDTLKFYVGGTAYKAVK